MCARGPVLAVDRLWALQFQRLLWGKPKLKLSSLAAMNDPLQYFWVSVYVIKWSILVSNDLQSLYFHNETKQRVPIWEREIRVKSYSRTPTG